MAGTEYHLSPRHRQLQREAISPIFSPSNVSRVSSSAWSVASETLKEADHRVERLSKVFLALKGKSERDQKAFKHQLGYLQKQNNFLQSQLKVFGH